MESFSIIKLVAVANTSQVVVYIGDTFNTYQSIGLFTRQILLCDFEVGCELKLRLYGASNGRSADGF